MNLTVFAGVKKFLKKRLIEFIGVFSMILAILLTASVITYSPGDPNFLYTPESIVIKNILGIQGSIISDFFLQSIGLISFLFIINLFCWGFILIKKKKINNFLSKLFYTIIYILLGTAFINIYINNSFWLIDHGNGGFVGRIINENLIKFIPFYENQYFVLFIFLFFIFLFTLSVDLKLTNILYIFKLPFLIFSKLITLFKRKNLKEINNDGLNTASEPEKSVGSLLKNLQPNLPFDLKTKGIKKEKQFKLPPLSFLEKNLNYKKNREKENIESNKKPEFLEKILLDFGIEGKIKRVSYGPVVTLNEFEPAPGIKVSKIINLSDDIARNTSSISTRVATIPGKNTIGIEIPNSQRENVFLSEIISDEKFNKKEIKLPIALGKSISGIPVVGDLSAMPHLLVAGTTGSGKSVCINSIIISLLYRHSTETCKFILIDPKMLELSAYEGIPNLLCPVITEAKKATAALGWTVKEMENRYKLMTNEGVKNLEGYNQKNKKSMPYIVVIVDEMSDLMLVAGKEIENYIQKLSQMARAAGIHIIMATQRPSVDVITGTIKANFPTRISFQVSSKIDSRTILGEQGAEQLLGKGDMLFMSSANRIVRIHAPYVSEKESEKISSFLRSQEEPNYFDEITNYEKKETDNNLHNDDEEQQDELYLKAVELIKIEKKASTSFLQRKLQIGYNRAARIIETMEKNGIVSQANHVGKREIL